MFLLGMAVERRSVEQQEYEWGKQNPGHSRMAEKLIVYSTCARHRVVFAEGGARRVDVDTQVSSVQVVEGCVMTGVLPTPECIRCVK